MPHPFWGATYDNVATHRRTRTVQGYRQKAGPLKFPFYIASSYCSCFCSSPLAIMRRLLLPLLLTALLAVLTNAQEDYCFGKDRERTQTRQFSSKTAYQIVKGTNMDKQYEVPGCVPKKIWIFHRHGTRLPTPNTIKEAPRLEEVRREINMCNLITI